MFLTKPPNGQYILKSSSPWGPYEIREVLLDMPGPIPGGGIPHQGGLVSTPGGDWYYMGFVDAYPGGRVPALAPITWTADGWPQVQTVNGAWGQTYPFPNLTPHPVPSMIGTDTFTTATLAAKWEWNHNPDDTKWSTGNGLKLQTATVTDDLYKARNTLTHRIQGPSSTATVELDPAQMADGDRAGLAVLRNDSAWIGLRRENGVTRISMTDGHTMDSGFNTVGKGIERASAELCGSTVWLRVTADIRPGAERQAHFSYSEDGSNFIPLGTAHTLGTSPAFFMGPRFAVFNHATRSLGGAITVKRFTVTA
jgi:beta-xylosidase